MGGVKAGRWSLVALLLAGVGAALAADGRQGPALAALGGAAGFLAQAGWSALRLAMTRMLEETRLEEGSG
ncbi:MAG: hypothetical protein A2Y93_16220 [Chloroflexi bacterium RBG_13_68_17]|jgi:hypothetical protein|nr:MAG: hypothetical protein A2Y93_16220 [Chloroflexi bacterium RBG_13_68_17]